MTIAQQLKIKDFPFTIKDKNGNVIYLEDSDGFWMKREYDTKDQEIRFENSNGYWVNSVYDTNGNQIYCENSDGVWSKYEYDTKGQEIYYENSDGEIVDNRPKIVEVNLQDIAAKLGISVTQLRIKD